MTLQSCGLISLAFVLAICVAGIVIDIVKSQRRHKLEWFDARVGRDVYREYTK